VLRTLGKARREPQEQGRRTEEAREGKDSVVRPAGKAGSRRGGDDPPTGVSKKKKTI